MYKQIDNVQQINNLQIIYINNKNRLVKEIFNLYKNERIN